MNKVEENSELPGFVLNSPVLTGLWHLGKLGSQEYRLSLHVPSFWLVLVKVLDKIAGWGRS